MVVVQSPTTARPPLALVTSSELYVCPFTVIESNAEQAQWTFQGIVIGGNQWVIPRKRQYMKTADYSIEGLSDRILIERKSPEDLVGSVTGGHKRLEAEHQRMLDVIETGGFACLICEGSLSEIDEALRHDDRHGTAETLLGCCASWPIRFKTPWFFAGDRRRAELLAFRILLKWWMDHSTETNSNDKEKSK